VALAGPIAGTVLTAITYLVYLSTGSLFIGSAAYWMAWLNLFNLIPLAMLDGGQLMESIVFSLNDLVGAIYITVSYVIAVFVLWHFNPILVGLVVFIGLPHVMGVWKNHDLRKKGLDFLLYRNPDKMNAANILMTIGSYVLTIMALLGLIHLCSLDSIHIKDLFIR
jgi:membrane-associated protease RseP (regulator of RpoE activity)